MNKLLGILPAAALACSAFEANAASLPDPTLDIPLAATSKAELKSIVLAGGCFWGVQAVFQHVKGVTEAVSGYAGGEQKTATYEQVSSGATGHAESVLVVYDNSQVTLGQILKVFFSVAHNPTELNYQGPDTGTQYRSAVFPKDDEQKKIVTAYIDQLNQAKAFSRPVVTSVEMGHKFYPAESYHQDYARLHPTNMYIVINDLPKVANLGKVYPDLYVSSR